MLTHSSQRWDYVPCQTETQQCSHTVFKHGSMVNVPCQTDTQQHYLYQTSRWGRHRKHHRLNSEGPHPKTKETIISKMMSN